MALLLAAVTVCSIQRSVEATMTGGGIFAGTVALPTFPCDVCNGGLFAGSASLSLSGLATTSFSGVPVPYAAVFAGLTNATAAFEYDEPCLTGQGPTPPVTGTADGSFAVTGGELILAGGLPLPATLQGYLGWQRVGVGARLVLYGLTITAPAGGSTVALNLTDNLEGESPTAFAWTNGPGTCTNPLNNQTALIAGIALQVA